MKKSRLGNLPKVLEVKNFNSILEALNSPKGLAEQNKNKEEEK